MPAGRNGVAGPYGYEAVVAGALLAELLDDLDPAEPDPEDDLEPDPDPEEDFEPDPDPEEDPEPDPDPESEDDPEPDSDPDPDPEEDPEPEAAPALSLPPPLDELVPSLAVAFLRLSVR